MDSLLPFQWQFIVKIHPCTLVEVEFVQRTKTLDVIISNRSDDLNCIAVLLGVLRQHKTV